MQIIFWGLYFLFGMILAVFAGLAICKDEDRQKKKDLLRKEEEIRRLSRDRLSRRLHVEDGVWLCEVEGVPSCNSRGENPEEALSLSREYVQKYLDDNELK